MYKQCFELLTAQGPKPHKSFSISQGATEVAKEYDMEIKSNIFSLSNQRIQLPPNSQQMTADFHNTGTAGPKRVGVQQSLNIVHQFLVFQLYVPTGESFNIELTVRDKHNTRRRLMFCDGTKSLVTNQMHARIPNGMVTRDKWINLCIDVNSFIRECFKREKDVPYGTPQIGPSQPPMANGQKAIGGGSGDIVALHSGKVNEISGSHIQKVAGVFAKQAQQAAGNNQNSLKSIEVVQLEGSFKIRKIFTSRSQIPAELSDSIFGSNNLGATAMSGNTLRTEDVIQAAMIGQRIEQIPKNFDFAPNIERCNQVISFKTVNSSDSFMQPDATTSDDTMMQINGMRLTSNTQNSGLPVFPGSILSCAEPNDCYSNNNEIETRQSYQTNNYLAPDVLKATNGSAMNGLKFKNAIRGGSKERKMSIGEDSSSTPVGQGVIIGNAFLINQADGSYRKGANASRQTQNSVVIVDQELNEHYQQESSQRNSSIGSKNQGQQNSKANHLKILNLGANNITGDTIFKQAHSTTSNIGQRSDKTQSTAYSVRTTSSGRQQKGKLINGGATTLQTSQSPFTENTSAARLQRDRSLHASNGRAVYEQVDEMEESGSGQVSLRIGSQQESNEARMNSPHIVAKSAKITRKAGSQPNKIDTNVPHFMQTDSIQTPKLTQLQEVHQTTILEENETMRGSMDIRSGSKLTKHTHSGAKKFNKVQPIEKKVPANLSAAGVRKGPASTVSNKNVRTKSSALASGTTMPDQGATTSNSIHPLVKGKNVNNKVSVSSTNLEDSIGGIVGNKIQSRQVGSRKKAGNPNSHLQQKIISPGNARKTQFPNPQLHASAQKHKEQPQFEVRNNKHSAVKTSNQAAQFLYNGSGYGTNQVNGVVDSDGEQSDFKTTTLRFTNNCFPANPKHRKRIVNTTPCPFSIEVTGEETGNDGRRERDSSTGAVNRDSSFHGHQNIQPFGQSSLMNTLNSQNNSQVQQIAQQNRNQSKQFGTSTNFKAGAYSVDNTDGFKKLHQPENQSKSPANRQFSTMHAMMGSQDEQKLSDQEEQIEEDICDHGESPLITAKTKQEPGHKAKKLFIIQQPPVFRSTESDHFNNTGFGPGQKIIDGQGMGLKDRTPFHEKSSILASKPYLGGKPRHQLIKSPEKSFADLNSIRRDDSEIRPANRIEIQKDIEEEIGPIEDTYEQSMERSSVNRKGDIDPNDTCTSDFYQVPIQGGIPVQLTIENGRRPFTPPFAQLIRVTKPPTGQSGSRAKANNSKPPQWVGSSNLQKGKGVMKNEEKSQIEKKVQIIAEGDEETIEEEIEVVGDGAPPMQTKSSKTPGVGVPKAATTKDSSNRVMDKIESRNMNADPYHTFAEEPIEYSESFQNKAGVLGLTDSRAQQVSLEILEATGSGAQTFGRRSRANRNDDEGRDDEDEDDIDRANPVQQRQSQNLQIREENDLEAEEGISASFYTRDVIDPKVMDQKKRLLYDKSLKAYYDPETGQYFEMKAQLIPQVSFGKLAPEI